MVELCCLQYYVLISRKHLGAMYRSPKPKSRVRVLGGVHKMFLCINSSVNKTVYTKEHTLFYTIYKITNKINNKFYIGMHKTNDLDDGYMGSGKLIKAAVKKHGSENFSKEILHVFDNEEDMKNKEKVLVVLNEMSYNLCDGGKGGFGYLNRTGKNISDSQKKTARKLAYELNKKQSKEQKRINGINSQKKIMEKYPLGVWKNKKHLEETKKKISSSMLFKQNGTLNSQYGTCWITNGQENKKIKKEELDIWLIKGYCKGRILI